MKRKIILGLAVVLLTSSLLNLSLKAGETLREDTFECENTYCEGLKSVQKAIVLDEVNEVYDSGNKATELCSKLGVQTGVSADGKKCMRFIVAVRDLNVNVQLNRKVIKENGEITNKSYKIENAYSAIKVKGDLLEPSSFNSQYEGADYKYFITYSVNGITEDKGIISVNVIVSDLNEENPLETVTNYNIADYAGLSGNSTNLMAEEGASIEIDGKVYTYKDGNVLISDLGVDSGTVKITKTKVTVQNSNLSSDTSIVSVVLLDPNMELPSDSVELKLASGMSLTDFINSNKEVLKQFPDGTVIRSEALFSGKYYCYQVKNNNVVRTIVLD